MRTAILLIAALFLNSCFKHKEKISVNENLLKDTVLIGKTAEPETPDSSEKISERKPDVSEINNQKKNFLKQFEKFKTVFNSKDISKLNEYINPECGFFVLDNPVSFGVNAYHFNSFDTIFNNSEEWHLYKIKKIEIHCKPKKGKLPVYGCEEDENQGWNKEGCFYNNDFENNQLTEIYRFIERTGSFTVYGEENYNKAIIKAKFKENADQIYSVVYSTEFEVGLYFGEINGKFYLLMIDLATPCNV